MGRNNLVAPADPTGEQEISYPENTAGSKAVLSWISMIVLFSLAGLTALYAANGFGVETAITAANLIIVLIVLYLIRREKIQIAGNLVAVALVLMVTLLATVGQGIHDIGIMAYPSILILASLVLKKKSTILLTMLSIVCAGWLALGEAYRLYIPAPLTTPSWIELLIVSGVLIFTAMFAQRMTDATRASQAIRSKDLQKRLSAEQALREAEAFYKPLVEQTTVVAYRDAADPVSSALYVSPQIENLIGYTAEEWTANPDFWTTLVHPDDLGRVFNVIASYLSTPGKSVIEYRLLTKDNRWVWVRDEAIVVTDDHGKPQFVHGVYIDITEQKTAELKLKQREAILGAVADTAQRLLKSRNWREEINGILKLLGQATGASHVYIFENHPGPDGIMLSSQKYEWAQPGIKPELDNPVYQNTRLIPVPGIEDWLSNLSAGKPFYGSGKQYPRFWKKVFNERGLKTLLDVPIFVNGEWWGIIGFDDYINEMPWSQAEMDALLAAAGSLGAAIERDEIDKGLRASEEKFNLAFRHTYVAMAINRTRDHILLDVNDSFCKVTGYARDEVIGKRAGRDLNIWTNADDRNSILTMLETQGFVDEYKANFKRKNGETATGLLYAVSIIIAGEPCQLFSFVDITNIEQLLNDLKAKNDELQAFTYTVSHDLKAPLVTISGFLGYLEQDTRNGNIERMNKDILRINEAIAKMQRLLGELLELSRIGRLMNPPEAVSYKEIVDEALSVVQGRLDARQVQVRVEAHLPSVYGDRARLVQVVQNLVDNAAKFMGSQPNPVIEIGAGASKGGNVFFVRDNGIGIEAEQHERVFGLFNKLDANTEGTGIGLALVKRIVEVHGGRIWLESDGLGNGTTFFFTLSNGFGA